MDILDLYLKDFQTTNTNNLGYLEKEIEYIKLPSLGFFYSGKYKNIKELPVRKLNTLDETLLCTESLHKNNRIFFELFKNVIEDKEFPIDELVQVDKDTILFWLKIGAYGSKYEIPIVCPNPDCKKTFKTTWDFSKLQFPDYPEEYIDFLNKNECLIYNLDQNFFYLTPPTLGKEYLVDKFIREELGKIPEEMLKTQKLLLGIKKIVNDEKEFCSIKEIYNFLTTNKLSLTHSKKLQRELDNITLKITLKKEVTCESCENSTILSLPPVSNNFFGFDKIKHKEYLDEAINYLNFWGRLDYTAALHLPSYKRKKWCERTSENLALLYKTK